MPSEKPQVHSGRSSFIGCRVETAVMWFQLSTQMLNAGRGIYAPSEAKLPESGSRAPLVKRQTTTE